MKRKSFACLVLFSMICCAIFGQAIGMGCVYSPDVDGKSPLRARQTTRSYTSIPTRYSLKKYCPTPKSQGNHGTCSSWSTTYAARTICEAMTNGWENRDSITKAAFAPIFIYKQLDSSQDCQMGTSIGESLSLLESKGAPKYHDFSVQCADYVPQCLFSKADEYKISGYTKLFDDYNNGLTSSNYKIQSIKKSLSENHPVIIAMDVYDSFCHSWNKETWSGLKDGNPGYHAMCVVGYDDEKEGGGFEIMNSWGTDFGKGGFIWVKYKDLCETVDFAYDMYLTQKAKPCPTPQPTVKQYSMSGDMRIVERDGGGTPIVINDPATSLPYYYINEDYPSGKKFRLIINNHEPAWVYIIASDKENNVTKLFPYADDISAYLNYSENEIALPDEKHEFELDNTAGIDYFCVLYSQEELDFNRLTENIRRQPGTFYEKLRAALGDKLAKKEDVRYIMNEMGFSAKTDRPIVPLVVEISHLDYLHQQ